MAELNTGGPKKKDGDKKVRSKKQDPFVDLTAMVDLAFLLITFFMLTTSLTKPQSMNLAMPDKSKEAEDTNVAESRTITLLLGTNDQLVWYAGQFDKMLGEPEVISYGREGLRALLLYKQQTTPDGAIVIIKPSPRSTYKNVVDALDEMVITGIGSYAIADIDEDELELLRTKGLD